MIDVFKSLRTLWKIGRVQIDSNIFRLHHSLTVILLLSACVVVTTKIYFGDPIDCSKSDTIPSINKFCWIHATYTHPTDSTIETQIDPTVIGTRIVPTGLTMEEMFRLQFPYHGIHGNGNQLKNAKYHHYYQWVCYVLLIQAVLFYVPRFIWRFCEGGRIQSLATDIEDGHLLPGKDRVGKKRQLVRYLTMSRGFHDWYAMAYFGCELLALTNVIGQMFILDVYFDGQFLNYGIEVIQYLASNETQFKTNPMDIVFPKMTKCKYYRFGESGEVDIYNVLCLLPINIINEKIYFFCWLWYMFLFFITGIMVMYHTMVIALPTLRVHLLMIRFHLTKEDASEIINRTSIGDWFLIYLLGKNIDPVLFKEIMIEWIHGKDGDKETESNKDGAENDQQTYAEV